jgi:hypothetical protein
MLQKVSKMIKEKSSIGIIFIFIALTFFNNAMPNQISSHQDHASSLMLDWRLISDQVMGGVSSGVLKLDQSQQYSCLHMQGTVSTANNGGFIQIAHDLTESEQFNASDAQGLRLLVRGNNQTYNLHLRTSDLWLPWQSFRASFDASDEWQHVSLNFDQFKAYKTSIKLNSKKIKRIGVVAIGRDFEADICVAGLEFY